MDYRRVVIDLLIVLNIIMLSMVVLKCILTVLTIDVLLLLYLIFSWYVICIVKDNETDM